MTVNIHCLHEGKVKRLQNAGSPLSLKGKEVHQTRRSYGKRTDTPNISALENAPLGSASSEKAPLENAVSVEVFDDRPEWRGIADELEEDLAALLETIEELQLARGENATVAQDKLPQVMLRRIFIKCSCLGS